MKDKLKQIQGLKDTEKIERLKKQLMSKATKRFRHIKINMKVNGEKYGKVKHGKCTDVLYKNGKYFIFKFENGNEFVEKNIVNKWFERKIKK